MTSVIASRIGATVPASRVNTDQRTTPELLHANSTFTDEEWEGLKSEPPLATNLLRQVDLAFAGRRDVQIRLAY